MTEQHQSKINLTGYFYEQFQTICQDTNLITQRKSLVNLALNLHKAERELSLESVRIVGFFIEHNTAANFGLMTSKDFALQIGLSKDQYWKRSQAARTLKRFPELSQMVQNGEISLSHVVIASAKISEENKAKIIPMMKCCSNKELKFFLAGISSCGNKASAENAKVDDVIPMTIYLKKSDAEKLERARDILSFGGKNFSTEEALSTALEDLLNRRDPLRRAERSASRGKAKEPKATAKPTSAATALTQGVETNVEARTWVATRLTEGFETSGDVPTPVTTALTQATADTQRDTRHPRSIPRNLVHHVYLRDGGACTFVYPDGVCCGARKMLEVDHIEPWSRVKEHRLENLRLLCRRHNQLEAQIKFGTRFWEDKQTEWMKA